MAEAQHKYSSYLVPNISTTSWKIHNVEQLRESCCWTCMNFQTEVPHGTSEISKWKISLYSDNNVLYGRSRLVSPRDTDITHKITFTVLKNGENMKELQQLASNKLEAPTICAVEASIRSKQPAMWNIIPLDNLSAVISDDQSLELFVETTVYGNDTFQHN